MQTITGPPYVTPIITTTPTTPIIDIPVINWTVAVAIIAVLAVILIILFIYNKKFATSKGTDVQIPIEKMISSDISLNKLTLIQLAIIMPIMLGIIVGLQLILIDPLLAMTIMGLTGLGTATPFLYTKDRYREKNRNRYKLNGFLWKKDGTRIKYNFNNVSFGTEAFLSEEHIKAICEADPRWTPKEFENTHLIPTKIGDEYEIYLILKKPIADTFEWVNTEDWDYFGTTQVKEDGLELLEITRLLKVRPDPSDETYNVNDYIPTLLSLWDASRSKGCIGSIMPVDVTNDTVLIGLTKQIGAEHRYTAGEVNAKEAALRSKNKGAEQLDILAESIGNRKAMEHIRNQNRLTAFTVTTNKYFIFVILAVASVIIAYVLGNNAGYAAAILEFFGD